MVVFSDASPKILLIQPVDSHDMEEMDTEVAYIRSHCDVQFKLVAIQIKRWNEELTPWPAPPVFGKIPFGSGAEKTLNAIKELIGNENIKLPVMLGGYSLAGLFALWAGTQHHFDGVVAASPSVWYEHWLEFSKENMMLADHVYLSLGDKEHRSKTPIMATVNDCIHQQQEILETQGKDCCLQMNPGNHFQDNGQRTAKGFVWVIQRLFEQ